MYKITFKMISPICFIDLPVFDGIIAYAYCKEKLGNNFVQKLSIDNLIDFSEMPIKKHKNGYFIASQMFFDNNINFNLSWRKRWESKYDFLVDGKNRKIRTNKGEFKSYDMPLNLYSIPEVYFIFDSDNISEVGQLINKYIVGIGKKISQGYGFYSDYYIEKIDIDFDKKIYRPIPLDLLPCELNDNYEIKFTSWKPPYWYQNNFELCVIPKNIEL